MARPKTTNPQALPLQSRTGSASTILDVAERLAQTRGYNGFSYADIAAELGVTKASLHYHFPSKAELGRALIARYHAAFAAALEAIDETTADASKKLRKYIGLYEEVIRQNRLCLCGMLAAEFTTLPAPMQEELKRFFDLNEAWLTAVLDEGRRSACLVFAQAPRERARLLLGALEGAMLVARSYGDPQRFQAAARQLLADCCAPRRPRQAQSVSA